MSRENQWTQPIALFLMIDLTTLPTVTPEELRKELTHRLNRGSEEYNNALALIELAEMDPHKPRICVSCLKTYPKDVLECTNKLHELWSKQ